MRCILKVCKQLCIKQIKCINNFHNNIADVNIFKVAIGVICNWDRWDMSQPLFGRISEIFVEGVIV